MKKFFIYFLSMVFSFSIFWSCEETTEDTVEMFPTKFRVDIPEALSSASVKKSGNESISGNDVYGLLPVFIFVGDQSGQMVEDIFTMIRRYRLSQAMEFSFVSDEDNRTKTVKIVENQTFENQTWEFMMTIMDGEEYAMKVLWNLSPVKGIAILQPSAINHLEDGDSQARIRIDYSEAETGVDQQMVVYITGLPTNEEDKMDKLKMKANRNGDIIEVYGNANIPGMALIDSSHQGGYSWCFVARSNEVSNIAVAQIAMPVVSHPTVDQIFDTYSMYNVFLQEINVMYPGLPQNFIDEFLVNTTSPGYFVGGQGFISCGTDIPATPAGFTAEFIDLSGLSPYVPSDVNNMVIDF